jgi:hypothetical protein
MKKVKGDDLEIAIAPLISDPTTHHEIIKNIHKTFKGCIALFNEPLLDVLLWIGQAQGIENMVARIKHENNIVNIDQNTVDIAQLSFDIAYFVIIMRVIADVHFYRADAAQGYVRRQRLGGMLQITPAVIENAIAPFKQHDIDMMQYIIIKYTEIQNNVRIKALNPLIIKYIKDLSYLASMTGFVHLQPDLFNYVVVMINNNSDIDMHKKYDAVEFMFSILEIMNVRLFSRLPSAIASYVANVPYLSWGLINSSGFLKHHSKIINLVLSFKQDIENIEEEKMVQMLFMFIMHAIAFCSKMNSPDFDKKRMENAQVVTHTTICIEQSLDLIEFCLSKFTFKKNHTEIQYQLSILLNYCMDIFWEKNNYVNATPLHGYDTKIIKAVIKILLNHHNIYVGSNVDIKKLLQRLENTLKRDITSRTDYDYLVRIFENYINILDGVDKPEDPLCCCVIFDPVLLPACDDVFEKAAIMSMLRENPMNPYNRQQLSIECFESYQSSSDENKEKLAKFVEANGAWFGRFQKSLSD